MNYRENSGEQITEESWVMRDLWDTRVKISRGLITIPKKLTAMGVPFETSRGVEIELMKVPREHKIS
jgi:hypothetical protein